MLLPWSGTSLPLYQQIYWNRAWIFHQILFKGYFMWILLPRRHFVIIFSSSSGNSSSCSSSGGGSSNGSDSASTCGSSSKILSWTGKYKLRAISGVRVGKYNLGTRVGKCKVSAMFGNIGWGPGLVDTNWGPRQVNTSWGPGAKQRAGGREIQRPSITKFLRTSFFIVHLR